MRRFVSITDFWLHTTSSSFLHTSLNSLSDTSKLLVGSAINETACPGPTTFLVGAESDGLTNCAAFQTASASNPVTRWGTPAMTIEAVAAAANQSEVNAVILVGDIAVLSPKSIPNNVDDLVFQTFGLSTSCQPVNGCQLDPASETLLACPSFSPPFQVFNVAVTESVGEYNITNNVLLTSGYPLGSVLNPYGAIIQLEYDSGDDISIPGGTPGWYQLDRPETPAPQFFVASCAITAYNITLSYAPSNSSSLYSLAAQPQMSNFNTTSALLAAYGTSLSSRLTTY